MKGGHRILYGDYIMALVNSLYKMHFFLQRAIGVFIWAPDFGNMMDSRAISRMGIGLYRGSIL